MSGVSNILNLVEALYNFRGGVFFVCVCVYFCARKMYGLNICVSEYNSDGAVSSCHRECQF